MDDTANLAVGTVSNTPGVAGTLIQLTTGQGARFYAKPPYNCTVRGANELGSSTTAEIVRVTARTADALTVERKAEPGSAARDIKPGDIIFDAVTEKTLKDIYAALEALIPLLQKGAPEGVATLDANGIVPVAELPLMAIENLSAATAGMVLSFVSETMLKFVAPSGGISKKEVEELIAASALILEHVQPFVKGQPGGAGFWAPGGNSVAGLAWTFVTPLLLNALNTIKVAAVTASQPVLSNSYSYCTGSGIVITTPGSRDPSDMLVIANANLVGGATVTIKGNFTPGEPSVVTTLTLLAGESFLFLADANQVWRPISESRTFALIEALITQPGRTIRPTGTTEPATITKNKAAPYTGPIHEHQSEGGTTLWRQEPNGGMVWIGPIGVEPIHQVRKAPDAQYRYQLNSDGSEERGPGGATAPDTTLRRSRPGVMATGAIEATKVPGAPAGVSTGCFQGVVAGKAPELTGTPSAEELAREYEVGDFWVDKVDSSLWVTTVKGGALGATKPGTFVNTARRDLATDTAGLLTQPFDLAAGGVAKNLTTGLLYLVKVPWPRTQSIKGFVVVVTGGSSAELTYGRLAVFGELAAGRMTMLGLSEDQKLQWTKAELARPRVFNETTKKPTTIEPKGGPGAFLYVGILGVQATTMPAMAGSNLGALSGREQDVNYGLPVPEYRAARGVDPLGNETFTTMPAEIEPAKSKNTAAKPAPLLWVGLE